MLVGGAAIQSSICQLRVTVGGAEVLGWLLSNCEKAAGALAGHLGPCNSMTTPTHSILWFSSQAYKVDRRDLRHAKGCSLDLRVQAPLVTVFPEDSREQEFRKPGNTQPWFCL